MAGLPVTPIPGGRKRKRVFGRFSLIFLLAMAALLALCLAFSWSTRDSMAPLSFLTGRGNVRSHEKSQKTLVDLRPWQTAEALSPLAVTTEEKEYAHDAERLADHEVDQAFASALRQASAQARHRNLTGDALALSQRVIQLQQLIKEDQALVNSLTAASGSSAASAKDAAKPAEDSDELEVAKAQLGLDTDELEDAQQELDHASGDDRAQIQGELTAHEALMSKYDSEAHSRGEIAVLSAKRHGTMASRITAWKSQLDRLALIQQAMQLAQSDIAALTAEHTALESKANANGRWRLSLGVEEARLTRVDAQDAVLFSPADVVATREAVRGAAATEARLVGPLGIHAQAMGEVNSERANSSSERHNLTETTGRAGLHWRQTSWQSWFNLTRAARPPALGERYGLSVSVFGNPRLRPERSLGAELGARFAPHGYSSPVWLEAVSFARYTNDAIVIVPTTQGHATLVNLDTTRVLGLEFAGRARVFKPFEIEANLTLLDPRQTTRLFGGQSEAECYSDCEHAEGCARIRRHAIETSDGAGGLRGHLLYPTAYPEADRHPVRDGGDGGAKPLGVVTL